jgi:hypothetical protein
MIRLFVVLVLLLAPLHAFADDGVMKRESRYPVSQTLDRLESILKDRGVTIFARIDHASEAEKVGLKLPPTQLLLFGNPRAGTPLMVAHPTIAIADESAGLAGCSRQGLDRIHQPGLHAQALWPHRR